MNEELVEEIQSLPEEDKMPIEGIVEEKPAAPEDMAAAFFSMQSPVFKQLLKDLAPYQIRRAVWNAVTYPFIQDEYVPETAEEQQFAYLVHELMLNRVIMQLAFEQQKVEKDLLKTQEVSKIENDETEEENNE